MRLRALRFSVFALGVVAAPAARAGILQSATWTQTLRGTTVLQMELPTLFAGGSPSAAGTSYLDGGVTSVSVSLTLSGFSESVFVPVGAAFVFPAFFAATVDAGVQWLRATEGMATVTMGMGIGGSVLAAVAVHTKGSMQVRGMTEIYRIPVSAGVKGAATRSFKVLGSSHYATIDFYGWMLDTQTFTGLTSKGLPLPDVVAMGSWGLSPVNPTDGLGGAGTITLVAPTRFTVDGTFSRRSVSLTHLTLNFVANPVPEPGTLLLLAAGGIALLRAAKRERR